MNRYRFPLFRLITIFGVILNVILSPQAFADSEQDAIDKLMMQMSDVEEDSALVDIYNQLAFHYGSISVDSSAYYLAKAKEIAQAIDYTKGMALNYSYCARVNMERAELDDAIANFDSAIYLFSDLNDSVQLLDCYLGLGFTYNYKSKKLHALECNKSALPLATALEDSANIALIYNNIGSFYYHLDDFAKTYAYFKMSLEIEESISDNVLDIALSYSNLAMLLLKNEKIEEAKPLFSKLKLFIPQIQNDYILSILHMSLASYHTAVEEFESSGAHLDSVSEILLPTGQAQLKARLYKRYADLYYQMGDYSACITSLDKNLEIQHSNQINDGLDEVYLLLANAYSSNQDYEKAYDYMLLYKEELLASDKKQISYFLTEFEEHSLAYDLEQRRLSEMINSHRIEKETSQLKLKFYIAIFVVIVLIYTLLIAIYNWHETRKRSHLLSEKNDLISQQKKQLTAQLNIIKRNEEKLIQSNITKDKFLSIIAHDLRSPFSSLIGFSELMVERLEKDNTDKVLDYAKLINEVANRSYALLNNLLEWAMEKAGKMSFVPQSLEVNTFLKEMLDYFNRLLPDRDITIESDLPEGFCVQVDHKMMQTIFRNLISNAFKYTPQEGSVTLKAQLKEDRIKFIVSDTGIGMSKERQEKLFKIEEAESTKGLNNEKGTGLGLILCKDFVEKHQGSIGVISHEGQGTDFYFDLPVS